MTRLEKAVTTVTDTAITNAGFSFAVTASERADTEYLYDDRVVTGSTAPTVI